MGYGNASGGNAVTVGAEPQWWVKSLLAMLDSDGEIRIENFPDKKVPDYFVRKTGRNANTLNRSIRAPINNGNRHDSG